MRPHHVFCLSRWSPCQIVDTNSWSGDGQHCKFNPGRSSFRSSEIVDHSDRRNIKEHLGGVVKLGHKIPTFCQCVKGRPRCHIALFGLCHNSSILTFVLGPDPRSLWWVSRVWVSFQGVFLPHTHNSLDSLGHKTRIKPFLRYDV